MRWSYMYIRRNERPKTIRWFYRRDKQVHSADPICAVCLKTASLFKFLCLIDLLDEAGVIRW